MSDPSRLSRTQPNQPKPNPQHKPKMTTKQVVEYAPPVELLRKPQGHFRALCEKVRCVCIRVYVYISVCVGGIHIHLYLWLGIHTYTYICAYVHYVQMGGGPEAGYGWAD